MKMKNKIILFTILLLAVSCNNKVHKKLLTEEIVIEKKKDSIINTNTESENTFDLELIQGIWNGEKDINMTKAYRVINNNKVLEIICVEGVCDGVNDFTHLEFGYIGFINKIKIPIKNLKTNDLKNQGKYLIYANKKINDNLLTKIRFDENQLYRSDLKSYKTTLSSNYMYETIYYGRFDIQDTTATFYKKDVLNNVVFSFIKKQSKKDKKDYIKEYNIIGFSKKIKVIADKTYFYSDYELKKIRKAFLVKGDIAYLESMGDKGVQVYFDGKVITSGFLKRKDVKNLDDSNIWK